MRLYSLLFVLFAWVAACEGAGPRDPFWGKQACGHCRMLLGEPRYAGQVLTADAEHLYFDDIGCMVEHLEEAQSPPRGVWVRHGTSWVDARAARYASGAPSPMGYGFVPEANGSLDFSAVRASIRARRTARRP